MKPDGVELAARFSYITNSLRYCGPDVHDEFLEYITHPEKRKVLKGKIREAIIRFESLYVYLDAIAKKHKKDFLDYDVVEAYWVGNSLLDSFTDDDIKKIINSLAKRGLPRKMAEEFKKKLPKGLKPSHNFHVLYVGVGNVAGTQTTTVQTMDNCMISSGKIVEIIDDKVLLQTESLGIKNNKFILEEDNKTAVMPSILGKVKIGDSVALHWGFSCMKMNKRQIKNLEKYTLHNLKIMKAAKKK